MTNPSRYLVLGRRTFSNEHGVQVRGAFNTATASLFILPENLAVKLEDPDYTLSQSQIDALRGSGAIEKDAHGEGFSAGLIRASIDLAVRTFVLMPTPACNMGCEYCGQIHAGKSLKQGYVDIVVPRVAGVVNDPRTKEINLNWFGGEPLLAAKQILQVAEIIRPLANEKGVIFKSQMTTNGSLFTPELLRKLVVDGGVNRIDVTVDGPKDIHDASRRMKNGSSTYEKILSSIKLMQDSEWADSCIVGIRTNVVESSIPFVEEYLIDLAGRGLTGPTGPMLQIAPVHEWGAGIEAHQPAIAKFAAAELRWLQLCAEKDLNYLPLPELAEEPCSAGRQGTETIDPEGYLFDCVEYPLTPKSRVLLSIGRRPPEGSVPRNEGPLMAYMPWQPHESGPLCQSCSLYPVCGGACALSRAKGQAQCPSMKYNFPERIDVAVMRHFLDRSRIALA